MTDEQIKKIEKEEDLSGDEIIEILKQSGIPHVGQIVFCAEQANKYGNRYDFDGGEQSDKREFEYYKKELVKYIRLCKEEIK